jgi:Mn2+/Fe2+ NRAMP family transporter
VIDIPVGNNDFWFLAAALIGAVFNPWMMFYQQSAMAEKQLGHWHYSAARGDTALGAVLIQLVSASVLFVAAAAFGTSDAQESLASFPASIKVSSMGGRKRYTRSVPLQSQIRLTHIAITPIVYR